MSKKLLLGTVVAAATVFAIPSTSHAGSNCKSGWNKVTSKAKKFFKPVSKFVCKELNTDNEAQAEKCLQDVEKFAEDVDKMKKLWNDGDNGQTKIGSRGLAHGTTETGNVKTERQFVGQPVVNDTYKLTIKRTGGKAKNDMTIKLCMVDENGNDARYKSVKVNKKKTKQTITIDNAAGLIPLIYLNNQKWGANGHKYTIRGEVSGEADAVAQAKATMKKAKGKKKSGKSAKAPVGPKGGLVKKGLE